MSEEIGLVMSLYDKVSPTLKDIAGNTKVFDKELEELEASLKAYDEAQNTLVSRAADLKKAMADNTIKVQDAQKAYKKLKDETSRNALSDAIDEQEKLKQALKETESAIKANNDGYKLLYKNATEAATAASKADNRVSTMTGSTIGGNTDVLSQLGQAGALALVGDVAGQWANAVVANQFGSDIGTYFGGALSGAASGAAIGSLIAPGVGTAVGAGLGGLVGLAGSAAEVYQNRNQAFVDYYNGLYDTASAAMDTRLSSGSSTASGREIDTIAFEKLLGEVGTSYLSEVQDFAAATPLEYGDLTAMSKALAPGFKDDTDRMLELIAGVGDTASALGLAASDMVTMSQILSRMQSSGKVGLEDLNMFQDRGIDVIGMLGGALGVDQGTVYDMISKGQIGGTQAVDILQDGFGQYAGAMEEMSQTFSGLSSTLSDTMANIESAMGSGYNATRSEGMAAEIEAYGGSLGSAMEEAYTAIGAGKAALENLGEAYTRDALSAVLEGKTLSEDWSSTNVDALKALSEEYQTAMAEYESGNEAAGFTLESIMTRAEAIAKAQTDTSDLYKSAMDAEEAALTALQENTTALEAATAAYSLEQTKTKGYSINLGTGAATAYTPSYAAVYSGASQSQSGSLMPSYAAGNSQTINVTVSGNNIKSDSDADELGVKVADAIVLAMKAGGGQTLSVS